MLSTMSGTHFNEYLNRPKIISNVLNYDDDMAILQQGSIKSIKKHFDKIEFDSIDKTKSTKSNSTNSTNSTNSKILAFILGCIIFMIVLDFMQL